MASLATFQPAAVAYEDDTVAWADAQVAMLRDRRFGDIDLVNIIEEIEGVAKTARTALASQSGRITEHLLNLIYSPAKDPRRGWIESIVDARREIDRTLDDSPSLRRELDEIIARNATRDAKSAAQRLKIYGELDQRVERDLLAHRFTTAQIVEDWLPPGVDIGR